MRLFNYHDTILYTLTNNEKQILIRNIMKKVNIRAKVKGTTESFIEYKLTDFDRPETIAHKVYGSMNYHWVILLMNETCNPYYDWVLSQREVEKLTEKRYGVGNENNTHHYVDEYGDVVTDEANIVSGIKYQVTNIEHEIAENEKEEQ